jgi:Caspase recruitment domain
VTTFSLASNLCVRFSLACNVCTERTHTKVETSLKANNHQNFPSQLAEDVSRCAILWSVQLSNFLYQSMCVLFSQSDMEEIEQERVNRGDTRAMMKLLLFLPCRVEDWLAKLMVAMKRTKHGKLLGEINPQLEERSKCQITYR